MIRAILQRAPKKIILRRQYLKISGISVAGSLSGCLDIIQNRDTGVDITVINRTDAKQNVEIIVESDGESVFGQDFELSAPQEGSVTSITEEDALNPGEYSVTASNEAIEQEYRYKNTCSSVSEMEDEIYITMRGKDMIEISSTYCGK
ncbi:hypothetical protein [Natronorubrum halophilum]|uniref:hypothetical protein n=1 Tax=Natronorubrum halophilum TaxID=1702106 RepID=UPI0013CEDEC7|nr:hypothetical protein [Natronorubrum halophilum]